MPWDIDIYVYMYKAHYALCVALFLYRGIHLTMLADYKLLICIKTPCFL